MRIILLFAILLLTSAVFGQNYVLPDGEYMDTTVSGDSTCKDANIYYYQVGGKYAKTSATLLAEAKDFFAQQSERFVGNGYITFQFVIDCAGNRIKNTRVLQTTTDYKQFHFEKPLVDALYKFLNTFGKWPVAKSKDGQRFPYKAFITFKIKDGKVDNIIP